MELTEDEIIKKYAKNCGHCNRNTLLPYEYEFTCLSSGYNVSKRKHELSKIQRKKIKFYQSIEICWNQIFFHMCRCIENIWGRWLWSNIESFINIKK